MTWSMMGMIFCGLVAVFMLMMLSVLTGFIIDMWRDWLKEWRNK
jgi:hypothetical protein